MSAALLSVSIPKASRTASRLCKAEGVRYRVVLSLTISPRNSNSGQNMAVQGFLHGNKSISYYLILTTYKNPLKPILSLIRFQKEQGIKNIHIPVYYTA
jgi:hypothetical protein